MLGSRVTRQRFLARAVGFQGHKSAPQVKFLSRTSSIFLFVFPRISDRSCCGFHTIALSSSDFRLPDKVV